MWPCFLEDILVLMMQVANGSLVTIVSQSQQWCSGIGRWRGSTPVWRLEWGFKQKVCTVLWPWMSGCCRHTIVIRTRSVGIMRFGMWSCMPCVCNLGYETLSSSPFTIFLMSYYPLVSCYGWGTKRRHLWFMVTCIGYDLHPFHTRCFCFLFKPIFVSISLYGINKSIFACLQ